MIVKSHCKKTQQGSALVQVSVAASLLGVLTTFIINLNQQQISLEKRTETNVALGLFHARIATNFNDKMACENTLNEAVPATQIITNNMEVIDIKDGTSSGGAVLYSKNYQFGKIVNTGTDERTFKIKSMAVEFDTTNINPDPSAPNYKTPGTLRIVYEVSSQLTSYQGNREKPRTISLGDIQLTQNGSSYEFRGCEGNAATISISPREACDSLTGVYDTGVTENNKCRLSSFFDYDVSTNQQLCSSTDGAYCVGPWDASNFNERQGVSAKSLVDYIKRLYGQGMAPNTTNLFLGHNAGVSNTTGTGNTFVGVNAGNSITTGSNNIMIGNGISAASNMGLTTTGSRQLNIGHLLIGKMPPDSTGSPNISTLGGTGLIVNGGVNVRNHIKIGSSSLPCNNANTGLLGYNTNSLQYCNGTTWTTFVMGTSIPTPTTPVASPPLVTAITPASGFSTGGTAVTITGSRFGTGTSVAIDGTPCSNVTVSNPSQITCTTPAGNIGDVDVVVINPNGERGTLADGFEYLASPNPPSIGSIYPASGTYLGGTSITITGFRFVSGSPSSTVTIGGNNCTSVNVVSSTQITCTTPAGNEGSARVFVRNPNGLTASSSFTYIGPPPPIVTSISPATGPTAGGTSVTIIGNRFENGTTATIGGNACLLVNVINASTITCTTPAGSVGNAPVVVVNPDGQSAVLSSNFVYIPPPTIASISPDTGTISGGTIVTITGTNFITGMTATVGGANCSSLTVASATQITCTTPARTTAGSVNVVVTNPYSKFATLSSSFTYIIPPIITSVDINKGIVSGGTIIKITGINFISGTPSTSVTIGVTACTSITINSAGTEITCTTPAKAAGTYDIVVTNPNGLTASLPSFYTYVEEPRITGLSPFIGAPGTTITITGTNFITSNISTVKTGSYDCTNINVVSATQLTCKTSLSGQGNFVSAQVSNAADAKSNTNYRFTYLLSPVITSVTPSSGPKTNPGNFTITIAGNNFVTGTTVTIGGSTCGIWNLNTNSTPETITCAPPSSTTSGAKDLVVKNSGSLTATSTYTYIALPANAILLWLDGTTRRGNLGGISGANSICNSMFQVIFPPVILKRPS